MARWSRFDPTNLDLTNFDLTKIDLAKVDLAKVDLAKLDLGGVVRAGIEGAGHVTAAMTGQATELAKDVTYVTVGATLLGVQRAQVRRREVARMLRR
jgi:uncharacterized protein YjbI with pentapeptide repeats